MFVKGIGYCIASIWLLQLAATNAKPSSDGRVVGGQYTTIDNFKYLVQIWRDGKFHCGGSLLTPNLVVTAAHCVVDYSPNQLTVRAGATLLSDTGVSSEVVDIIPPSAKFDFTTKDNDMSLLKLQKSLKGAHIDTIALFRGKLKPGMNVTVSGWGLISEKSHLLSRQLNTVTVPITDKANCVEVYKKGNQIVTNNMFCASEPGVKDSCSGDSGGPAVIDGKLAGIVSFGMGCAQKQYPGIYTDIQEAHKNMKSWI